MVVEIVLVVTYTIYTTLSVAWMFDKHAIPDELWKYFRMPLMISIWLGLNRPLMYLQALGPFIQMLGQTVVSTGQFAFLFVDFLVPFVCGIWICFGTPGGILFFLTGGRRGMGLSPITDNSLEMIRRGHSKSMSLAYHRFLTPSSLVALCHRLP